MTHNPEKPSDNFLKEYGDEYNEMLIDLDVIANKLKGQDALKDYIVWLHQQSEVQNQGEKPHWSIYLLTPNGIDMKTDFPRLFDLTCEKVSEYSNSLIH